MKKFSLYSDMEKSYRAIKIDMMIIAGSFDLLALACSCISFYFKDYVFGVIWLIGFVVCCALSYSAFKED